MTPDTFGMICLWVAAALLIIATAIDERHPQSFNETATRFDYKRPAKKKSEFSLRWFAGTTAIAVLFAWLFVAELANDNTLRPPADAVLPQGHFQ
jgi:hypothetical protein